MTAEPSDTLPAGYEQLKLPIEIADPQFDDEGDGAEHSGAEPPEES